MKELDFVKEGRAPIRVEDSQSNHFKDFLPPFHMRQGGCLSTLIIDPTDEMRLLNL